MRPVALEGVRAVVSTPEAVAKLFAPLRFLYAEFGITKASQVWNTDESMMYAEKLMSKPKVKVIAHKDDGRPEFVVPSLRNGAKATSLVATICADGSRLPLFVVVADRGERIPFAAVEQVDGTSRRVPLASFLDDGAEVHRREKPGFDRDLWETFARLAARQLEGCGGAEWKVLLMDGCKVHASAVGLRVLKDAKVVVLMFPSYLSHMLQALDGQPFLMTKARSVTVTEAMLPTLPRGAKFNLFHVMKLINQSAFHGRSSVNIVTGFRETGTWPISPGAIDVTRLLKGKGTKYSRRKVDIERLCVRLGPEARREMREQHVSFGSVPTRGRAVEATSEAVLGALGELDKAAAAKRSAKDKLEANREAKRVAAIEMKARTEAQADARRNSREFRARKDSWRRRAAQARAAAGPTGPYESAPCRVVDEEPRRKRAR